MNGMSPWPVGIRRIPGVSRYATLSSVDLKFFILAPCYIYGRIMPSMINFYRPFLKSLSEIAYWNYPRRTNFHSGGKRASQKYEGLQAAHQSHHHTFNPNKHLFLNAGLYSYRGFWPSLIIIGPVSSCGNVEQSTPLYCNVNRKLSLLFVLIG